MAGTNDQGSREVPLTGEASGKEVFWRLPVFQLVGGTGRQRRDFANRLLGQLDRRSLSGLFLDPAACRLWQLPGLVSLATRYDLLLVDGEVGTGLVPIHLDPSAAAGQLVAGDRLVDQLQARLDDLVRTTPVWACVLIGGKSSRMGRPKHLLPASGGRSWLERTVELLRPLVDGLVVSGTGGLPEALTGTPRLADIPGLAGPLTGILAASRWQPMVSWLLVACDMPHISAEAIRWMLDGRRAGCWGRVPQLAGSNRAEPLLAWYDLRARQLFERQFLEADWRIGLVADHPKIARPVIPATLARAWRNINTPDQLAADRQEQPSPD